MAVKETPESAYWVINGAYDAFGRGDVGLKAFPGLLDRIIREELWKRFYCEPIKEMVEYDDFFAFVKKNVPRGLGLEPDEIRRMLEVSKAPEAVDVLKAFNRMMEPAKKRGAPKGNTNNPGGRAGKGTNCDNITISSRNDGGGTSSDYTIRRLKRDRPDLAEKVIEGEISANAAAIEAGFRKKTITVPVDTGKAADAIKRHFTKRQIKAIIKALQE